MPVQFSQFNSVPSGTVTVDGSKPDGVSVIWMRPGPYWKGLMQ
jgi:hypothetical protein